MPTISEEAPAKKKFTFKLRSGQHDVYDPVTRSARKMVPGDIISTDEDLKLTWGRHRWEKIDEANGEDSIAELKARIRILEGLAKANDEAKPKPSSDPDLEGMSVKQLREFGNKLSPPVDTSTCTGKAEIISVIRSALDAA